MTKITLGKWLTDQLAKKEWSKSDLARKSGISPSQITRLIKGERGVRDDTLYAIATALKFPPEIVFLISVGRYDDQVDHWAEESARKVNLVPVGQRTTFDRFIDALIDDEDADDKTEKKK